MSEERVIFMKKYCLNIIMKLRDSMIYPSEMSDFIRVQTIKVWLEQYFIVEARFGGGINE